jgi:hypothetical protein
MNHPAIFVKTMPLSLSITIGLTLNAAALIIAVSMSGTAHAQTAPESSITSGLYMSAQIRYAETSIERQPSAGKGEPAKSGAGNKNSQRLDRRQEMNREEKAGGSSSTDQGSQRKIRRALA